MQFAPIATPVHFYRFPASNSGMWSATLLLRCEDYYNIIFISLFGESSFTLLGHFAYRRVG